MPTSSRWPTWPACATARCCSIRCRQTAPWSRPTVPRAKAAPSSCAATRDRKSTRLNSSHLVISYAVFCLKKKRYAEVDDETCLEVVSVSWTRSLFVRTHRHHDGRSLRYHHTHTW